MKGDRITSERESIWSVDAGSRQLYFRLFLGLTVLGIAVVGHKECVGAAPGEFDLLLFLWERTAAITVSSAAIAIVLVEAKSLLGEVLVLLGRLLRRGAEAMFINWGLKDLADRILEKQLQDKLAEGREEGREEYRLWHERYEAARERGEEFEEPPPGENHG